MFNLSSKSDYGLLLLSLLAKKKKNEFVALSEISGESGLPYAFVSRIASQLAKAGLLKSKEGANGGHTLGKKPEDISVALAIEALDGPWQPTKCEDHDEICSHKDICPMTNQWQKNLKEKMWQVMENFTLKDLIKVKILDKPE